MTPVTTDAQGSSGTVKTIEPGIVEKKPWDFKSEAFRTDAQNCFVVEQRILEHLGRHPRLVE